MGATGGGFHGYRELAPLSSPRQPMRLPFSNPSPPQITPMELAMLQNPTYDLEVYDGTASDDYPEAFTQLPFKTRMFIVVVAPGGYLDMELSFDGIHTTGTRTFRRHYRIIEAIQAFRVRNTLPGLLTWWQLTAMV